MSVTTGAPGSAAAAAVDMIEQAKRKAAYRAVADHFDSEMQFVGIGSGSTIIYGVEAIKDCLAKNPPKNGRYIFFVPTGFQSRKVIEQAGLMPMGFDSLPENVMLDVAFDGADEVDDDLNCIKGGGACLFQEKLVATRAKKFVCIADYRKNQTRLITKWPSIPIEVAPIAHATVMRQLKLIGSINPVLREHTLAKTGPIQTDQGFYIIDAPFKPLLTQEDVTALAHKIKSISGVLEVGLFFGPNGYEVQAAGGQGGQKPVAAYFGNEDGSVSVKEAKAH
ncbi:ribose 5-phosphate isomerase A [Aureobasidium melanogenum CBS 110374]|uniref:Ribose-5-phosphate isomerase n=1 Tax=Aureobasidium melanogenum (strain CBS 110374) TaxID=1043003 RepID=A0A074W1Z8_AURM1|nr:ribose 5-phosphate isomerase A [Aureobasidium melanogenum CBS 110374]KEQ65574.1 ribose 5-phosphate isomerase A [Aureobasidium melanogenum CBS 110374]